MSSEIFLSIVVPIKSGESGWQNLLESLKAQILDFPFEVLFVSNPTTLSPDEFGMHSFPFQFHLLNSKKIGANAARNMGARAAKGKWLYFIDHDCSLPSNSFLKDLKAHLEGCSEREIFGGSYLYDMSSKNSVSKAYHILQERWIRSGFHPKHRWIHFLGGNLILPSSVFRNFHFDEGLVFGATETELLYRLLLNGYMGNYLSSFALDHEHSLSPLQLMKKALQQGYGHEKCRFQHLDITPEEVSFYQNSTSLLVNKYLRLYRACFDIGRQQYRNKASRLDLLFLLKIYFQFSIQDWLSNRNQRRKKVGRILSWVRQA